MLVLFYISLPLVKEQPLLEKKKPPSVNNEHLCTADTAKAWESNHIRKQATQQPIHTAWQMHVYKPKQTLPFPIQYKLANARRTVYFLIFLAAESKIWTTDPGRLQRVSRDVFTSHWTF